MHLALQRNELIIYTAGLTVISKYVITLTYLEKVGVGEGGITTQDFTEILVNSALVKEIHTIKLFNRVITYVLMQ